MLVFLSFSTVASLAFIIFCMTAFFSGTGHSCFDTLLMKEIPKQLRGTFFGIIQSASNTLLAISMFLTGTLLDYLSPRLLGFLGGLSFILISIILLASHLHHDYGTQ